MDSPFKKLTKDNIAHLFLFVPIKDLIFLRKTDQNLQKKVDEYIQSKMNLFNENSKKIFSDLDTNQEIKNLPLLEKIDQIFGSIFFDQTTEEAFFKINQLVQDFHLKDFASLEDFCLENIMAQVARQCKLNVPLKAGEIRTWMKNHQKEIDGINGLIFNFNNVFLIPEEVKAFKNIKNIMVFGKTEVLPKGISYFSNLESLNISELGLKKLPNDLSLLPLKHLNAKNNSLSFLPILPKTIEELNLSDNCFTDINSLKEICSMNHLKVLKLAFLKIKDPSLFIQDILSHLPKTLEELDLSKNSLSQVPIEIFQLPELKQLSLFSCQLEHLPPKSKKAVGQKLKLLFLYDNQLKSWPKIVADFFSLSVLILSQNSIQKFLNQEDLKKMKSLKHLDLNENPLKEISEAVSELENLQQLFLENTKIQSIPESLNKLSKLQMLKISSSKKLQVQIEHLPQNLEFIFLQDQLVTFSSLKRKENSSPDLEILS